jgi:large subunit ribosomal protein L25
MKTVELNAKKREVSSHSHLRSSRVAGDVPAVIYGGEGQSYTLSVNAKEFMKLLTAQGLNMIVNLKVDSKTETALVKEVQRHIIGRQPIHIDFQRISMTQEIEVSVPLHVKGDAPGVKVSGGILEHILREVRVKCVPTAIPQSLDVDVTKLELNQGLKVKDLAVPAGVKMITDPEHLVVNVVAPMAIEETTTAAAAAVPGAAAEPEVIAKGKKPLEGEEGAAAPAAGGKPGAAAPAAGAKDAKPGAKPAGK